MRIAIMQPYLFPYIGYFQLINFVDRFIILDDVNYIKKGWINRNRILNGNKDYLFTIPLNNASQNKLINELQISSQDKWQVKLLKTIEMSYKKAPQFNFVFPVLRRTILNSELNLSSFILESIKALTDYLEIDTDIIPSSVKYQNPNLKAQDKIIDICIKEGASNYINPIGGVELYDREIFNNKNITLNFLKTGAVEYPQFSNEFISNLSIIDVMMFNSRDKIKYYLQNFDLL